MTPGRISCCVLFCKRTRKPWGDASAHRWVCGPHWRHVSKTTKRRMSWALRRWNKLTCRGAGGTETVKALALARIWWRTFDLACTEANEAAAGIA